MKRRLLSLLLVFVMVLGMFPVQAIAAADIAGMTIPDTYCTIESALDYAEDGTIAYDSGYGAVEMPKYVVQIPAGTDTVTITLGNNICLTPNYPYDGTYNFYYGTLTWSDDADGYGTPGYKGRTQQAEYTVVAEGVSAIELDVASLIAD
ncbi:MAG: hypothetical protein IKK61_05775, partial [Clostridia bacterium]|nr:hypothetical protein [Clostridia bacterium]